MSLFFQSLPKYLSPASDKTQKYFDIYPWSSPTPLPPAYNIISVLPLPCTPSTQVFLLSSKIKVTLSTQSLYSCYFICLECSFPEVCMVWHINSCQIFPATQSKISVCTSLTLPILHPNVIFLLTTYHYFFHFICIFSQSKYKLCEGSFFTSISSGLITVPSTW